MILLGYGLPAVLAAVLAYLTRHMRPREIWRGRGSCRCRAFAYLSLEVRTLYHGPILTGGPTSDPEQYAYSAVWLAFGVALLSAGIWFRSLHLRLASAAVVVLTVLKVFLIDMTDITGIYRAFVTGTWSRRLVLPAPPIPAERRLARPKPKPRGDRDRAGIYGPPVAPGRRRQHFKGHVRMAWAYLILAGLFEMGFASTLKLTQGFTKPPTVALLICATASFILLAKAAQTLPIGTTYAVRTGIGAAGTAILGIFLFNEPATGLRLFCLTTLVASIIGLKLATPT